MSFTADVLFDLLPAIHRIRDVELAVSLPLLTAAEEAELATLQAKVPPLLPAEARRLVELSAKRERGPLRSLLTVIAEQIGAIEESLEQLYDDQFIETCAEWAAPYIGDLIGYRTLHGVVPRVASPRAEVANTIRFRRRKGTASMLEQLARDVTGWPARAVEFFLRLGWTQHMNHVRPDAHYAPDLRKHQPLLWRDTAFDSLAHTVDVRRIATGAGRYNIPNVGLFLWRIRAVPLTRSPVPADPLDAAGRLLRFDPLGLDAPLFTRERTEEDVSHLAEPLDVPLPIGRRFMATHLEDFYGAGRSVLLELAGAAAGDPPDAIPIADVCACDLSDLVDSGGTVIGWAHVPAPGSGKVAIDPVLGRMAFADAPARAVLATFHRGSPMDLGGGEYHRDVAAAALKPVRQVLGGAALQPELDAVAGGGVVEILDSGRYEGTVAITADAGKTVVLRAADGTRPLIVLGGDLVVTLGDDATVVLDGVVIAGGAVHVVAAAGDKLRHLRLGHCTLVPASTPSLVVDHAFAAVDATRCVLGALHVVEGAASAPVSLVDCIVDATSASGAAYRGPSADLAPGRTISIVNSTVVGKVHATEIALASNTLFVGALAASGETWKAPVWADRRQAGCIRFSYVPPGSRTPRRFHCQPPDGGPDVRPYFASLRFGDPAYAMLRAATPDAIRRGADDESEMGVFHDLFQPQRETNLRVRFDEYLRFGLEAGIFYAS